MSPVRTRVTRVVPVLFFVCSSAAVMVVNVTPSAANAPAVTITPTGPYHNGQTVTVSVGANSLFTPDQRIIFIECNDPGGSASGLPTSVRTCDGNTVQADTVLVGANGSFTEHHFVLYSLPNQAFAELPDAVAVCDASHPCVLYVGENQEDFTQPKVFSNSFSVSPTPGSAPSSAGSSPTSTSGQSTPSGASTSASPAVAPADPSAAVTLAPTSSSQTATAQGTLAFTGMRPLVVWLVWIGSLMVLVGSTGRRLVVRGRA